MAQTTCKEEGCESPHLALGWCNKHYKRVQIYGDPNGSAPRRPIAERFWEKVDRRGALECWPWTACRMASGYGHFYDGEGLVPAHRYSWEIANLRWVPTGLWVLHSCDNPPCVNPVHLWLGTVQDNNADRDRKGRNVVGTKLDLDIDLLVSLREQGLTHNAIGAVVGANPRTVGGWLARHAQSLEVPR